MTYLKRKQREIIKESNIVYMSAREVLRLLFQIAEDMNSVLGLPSTSPTGKFSFPEENKANKNQRVKEICESLLGANVEKKKQEGVERTITSLFMLYSRVRKLYKESGLNAFSSNEEVQKKLADLRIIIAGVWMLNKWFQEEMQSDKLALMQQHVNELEEYLANFGYDRNVMSDTGARGIDILLNRLLVLNSV